jgi:hypothetical protein
MQVTRLEETRGLYSIIYIGSGTILWLVFKGMAGVIMIKTSPSGHIVTAQTSPLLPLRRLMIY